MKIVDVGRGLPIVLVPGIQGRWEWMRPAVEALAVHCRVITFSLADEPGWTTCPFDESRGLDAYVDQIRDALDQAGVSRAVVCGVSYGGVIAARFAARYPQRAVGLVLVSAVPPSWKPNRRVLFYLRAPRLLSPLFCLASLRLYREIAAATPGVLKGIRAALGHGLNAATHMFSPRRMARRVLMLEHADRCELASVQVPVLIVTGDAALERVVPVALTREYLSIWPHAEARTLPGTGHLGLITRPAEFAALIVPFAQAAFETTAPRRRIG